MRILTICADWETSKELLQTIHRLGHAADLVDQVADAVELLEQHAKYDVLVCEPTSVKVDPQIFAKAILSFSSIPVLIVSSDSRLLSRMNELGGNVQAIVSSSIRTNLDASLKILMSHSLCAWPHKLRGDNLEIDLNARKVSVRGEPISLSKQEYKIIEILILKQGKTVSRADLISTLYAPGKEIKEQTIDVFINHLKQKIYEAGGRNPIGSVWGLGFRIDAASSIIVPSSEHKLKLDRRAHIESGAHFKAG